MRRYAVLIAVAASLGCGSSNSVNGTIQGQTLSAQDALLLTNNTTVGGTTVYGLGVSIMNISNACSTAQADISSNKDPANAASLTIGIGSTSPIAAGTFNITSASSPAADAIFVKTDSSCHSTIDGGAAQATSGTVTLSSVSASSASGTFDLTFGSDHVTGSFSASSCTLTFPDGGTDGGGPTCNG